MNKNTDAVYINSFQIENVKRVEAVTIEIKDALTVIGGNNGQGKSSVLDAICWTLGGDKFKPSSPVRAGAEKASTKIVLSNGMIVERYGKNGSLRVTTKDGRLGGQQILNEFINQFALDIKGFMDQSDKEKAKTLLKILDVDLDELDALEKAKYDERTAVGREAERAKAYVESLKYHANTPNTPVSAGDLADKISSALEHNSRGANLENSLCMIQGDIEKYEKEIASLQEQLKNAKEQLSLAKKRMEQAEEELAKFEPIDLDALRKQMHDIEAINQRVRDNQRYNEAMLEAKAKQSQYDKLTEEIEQIRSERASLLESAKLPLPGLSVKDGCLTYKGHKWDCLSHSEQLRVATSIVRAIQPKMGFVIIDKIESMDIPTLKEFGAWLESEGLQAITTRVSTGDECSIIIENGKVK